MSNSILKPGRYNVSKMVKCKWLCLALLLALSFSSNAQVKGYTWIFNEYDSLDEWNNRVFWGVPATAATSDTKPMLTVMNPGNAGTFTENQSATIASCPTPSPVGEYSTNIGFEYTNPGSFITNTYTIEMVINFTNTGNRRLLGFYSLSDSLSDYGVYLNSTGGIDFYNGTNHNINTAALSTNTWYHLAFVREPDGDILYYKDGAYVGSYADNLNQFIPHTGNPDFNIVTFLKDDNGEESSGKLAKVSIYDAALIAGDIQTHFEAICDGGTPPTTGGANYIPKYTSSTTFGNSVIYESEGSIGIGTTDLDTSYKLFVEKGIRTRLVQVDIDIWPDYVFDKKYKLPSLQEIEKHIEAHNHLPGIPAAAEVEEKGLDVGKNQAALLQKIEELTLYIIEQNKKIEALNTRMLEMEKNQLNKKEKSKN